MINQTDTVSMLRAMMKDLGIEDGEKKEEGRFLLHVGRVLPGFVSVKIEIYREKAYLCA